MIQGVQMTEINGVSVPFMPAGGAERLNRTKPSHFNVNPKSDFKELLSEEIGKLKFSGHATKRINGREINLTELDIMRLENAVEKAESKNSKDSLVILDEKAFIVNVPNRTIVTLLNKSQLNENVITQIDSAVFA
jgi:flagellar operon protein